MSSIVIDNLHSNSVELSANTSYITDLVDNELNYISGGGLKKWFNKIKGQISHVFPLPDYRQRYSSVLLIKRLL